MTKPKPHTEQFTITRRPGWGADIAVTIECNPTDYSWVKLGLAVRVAYQSGASLDGASLDGARLDGASLNGASLVGASLDGARLVGARLDGASLVGASLDGARLVGARLDGASLDGARLDRASLVGASLVGASLDGAIVRGEKVTRVIAIASRLIIPYVFTAFELAAGGYKINAGCRWYSDAQFRAHVAKDYPGKAKAAETLAILDFIAARASAVGVVALAAQAA